MIDSPLNLLVIEDNPADFLLLEHHLRKHRLAAVCTCVASAQEMQNALEAESWDVVLTEYSVPGMSFDATLEQLYRRQPDLPVILISGLVSEERTAELLGTGIADFILKSNLTRLIPAIQRCLREADERSARRTAEAALRNSEAFQHAILDSVSSHLAVLDRHGMIVSVNESWRRFARENGVESARPAQNTEVGVNYLAVCREADGAESEIARAVGDGIQAVLDGRLPKFTLEYPCHSPDKQRWFSMTTTPLQAGDGGVVIAHTDITERKQAEAALEHERSFLKTLFQTVPDLIWLKDPNGVYLACNRRFEQLYGASEAEIRGKTDYDFVDRQRADFFQKWDRVAIAAGKRSVNEEELSFAADGHREWVETIKTPMRDGEGQLVGVIGIARDITAQKRTEQTLQEAMMFLRQSQSIARLGGWKANPVTGMLIWTEEVYHLVEHALETPPASLEQGLRYYAPEFLPTIRQRLWQAWEQGTPFTTETEMITASGRRFWAELRCVGRMEYEGETYIAGTLQDISERRAAEQALRHSEERYRALVESQDDALCRWLPDSTLTFVNSAYQQLFASPGQALTGCRWFEFIPATEREAVAAKCSELATRPAKQCYEHSVQCSDGQIRWFQWVDVPLLDDQGICVEFQSMGRDITERKQMEQALRTSEESLNKAQAIAQIGSWTLDFASGDLVWSQQTYRMFGLPCGTALTLDQFTGCVHQEDRAWIAANWNAAIAGAAYDVEHRIVVNDEVRWVRERAEIFRDAAGVAQSAIGTVQDITERKLAEQELRKAYELQSTLLDKAPALIWRADADARCIWFNTTWLTFTGRTLEQEQGDGWAEGVHPDDFQHGLRHYLDAFHARRSFNREYRLKHCDGTYRWIVDYGIPLHSGAGDFVGYIGYCLDITERKRIAAELDHHRHHLEELVARRTAELEAANRQLLASDLRLKALFEMSQQAANMDERELLQRGIEEAVRLTGSEIGYLHFVNDDQETIQLHTWSAGTLKYCAVAYDNHYPISMAGVWAETARHRLPVTHNDYQHLPNRKGYPSGHAHLIRHMGVPVLEEGKVRVLLGVGNKPTDYDESDEHGLQLIGDDLWRIVMRRRAEVALAAAKESAEQASRAKSAFLANMSHEIRTPMNAIIGLTHLLRRSACDPQQQEQLRKIDVAARHLLAILNDILDLSKIEVGKLELEHTDFNLSTIFDYIGSLTAESIKAKELELILDRGDVPTQWKTPALV